MKKGIRFSGRSLGFRTTGFLAAMAVAQILCPGGASVAKAACTQTGDTIICDGTSPQQDPNGVQKGPSGDNLKITVQDTGRISSGAKSAISVGSSNKITINWDVENRATDEVGLHGQRANTVEGNALNEITINGDKGLVWARGRDTGAAAIKMMGHGNVITNHGAIKADNSAAVWFQNNLVTDPTALNKLINHGAISTAAANGIAIGSNDGLGVELDNYGLITGSVSFGNGDDVLIFRDKSTITGNVSAGGGNNELTFHSGSTLTGNITTGDGNDTFTFNRAVAFTGNINAGKGQNTLTLINSNSTGSTDDFTLAGDLTGLTNIIKQGTGGWRLNGNLAGTKLITVEGGELHLGGAATDFYGQVVTKIGTALSANVKSLPVRNPNDPGSTQPQIINDGSLYFSDNEDGSYSGLITGSGHMVKRGNGTLLLLGENTITGNMAITQGTLALTSDKALGVVGADTTLSFDGGALKYADNFTFNANRKLFMASGGGTIDTGGFDVTLSQVIHGTINTDPTTKFGSLTKTGEGTLTLTGVNTYSGGTIINEGTLAIRQDRNLGAITGGLTFGDNGTLRFVDNDITLSASRAVTINGTGTFETTNYLGSRVASNIGGSGNLIKTGYTELVLSGNNTYSGTTEISQGELRAGSSKAFSANSHFKIGTEGILNLNDSDQTIGGLEGAGFLLLGANKLTINQNSNENYTYSGAISGINGTLSKSGSGGLMLASDLAQSLTLEVNGPSGYLGLQRNSDFTLENKLTGNGTLLVDLGGHDLSLDQAKIGADFTGTLDIQNANLALDATTAAVLAKAALELSENSKATLDANRTIDGLVFDGGTLNVDDHVLTVDNLNLKSGGTVQLDASALSNQIDPDQNIFDYADGAAQIAVVKANNITGGTGGLDVKDQNGNSFDQGAEKEIDGGKIYFDVTARVVNDDDANKKGVYVGYGPSQVEAYEGKTVVLSSTLAPSQTGSATPRLDAKLTGSGGFTFKGDRDVKVGHAASDYRGATTIDGLKVTTTTDKAFGNTSLLNLINSGQVDLDGQSLTVGGLAGQTGTSIDLGTSNNSGGLTVKQQAGENRYDGNINGHGVFVKDGSGTLVLGGVNSYTGATIVRDGVLMADSAGAFNQNQAWQVNGGLVDLNGHNLKVSQLSGTGGGIALNGEAGLTVAQDSDTTYRGIISGSGALTKDGDGDLTLRGRNTYSGETRLKSGSLTAGAAGVFSSASIHVLDDTSVLNLGGFDQTVAGLRGTSTQAKVALGSGGALTVDSDLSHSYAGLLTGDGSLVKTGDGQQELTNANNNFTGGIDIRQGSVKLTKAGAAGSGDLLVKADASLILDNSGTESMANNISGRGAFVKRGLGNLNLTGAVDLGTINVQGGLMSLADTVAANEIIIAAGAGLEGQTLLFDGGRVMDLNGVHGSFGYERMEVRGRGNQVIGDLPSAAGKGLHFVLPANIRGGEVMLSLDGQALNIAGASLSLEAGGYLRELIGGEQIILIDKTTGTIAAADQGYQAVYAGVTTYHFQVDQNRDQLAINYQGRSGDTSKAKAYLEAPMSGLALTSDHGRLVADLASRQIIQSTENGVGVLAGITASHYRVKTGSHADIDGFSYMAGPAWRFDNLSGVSRVGVFIEGGTGDYDAFNRVSNRNIKGSGDIDHIGGVVFGRHDFTDNYYVEGSFRMGRVETDYKTRDLGTGASFDSSALYWGAHLGGGYLYAIDDQSIVQPYLNVYFTRQNSDSLTTKAGERVKLDSANSVVTRLGARYSHTLTETITARVGAAWDQELDGQQNGTIDDLKIPNPSMKGASAFGEIGLSYQPQDAPYYVEINAFGNAGQRDGGGGQAAIGVNF